ncbi:MAG: hypothetical protein Q8R90_10360 [Bacteroidales bacterium]|nr:hypothetical protein [Bacteroidales bacterium]
MARVVDLKSVCGNPYLHARSTTLAKVSSFDKKRVKNNAIINIVQHSKGYLSVEVLSGMQIEKMVV